jgi:hypothetical protein
MTVAGRAIHETGHKGVQTVYNTAVGLILFTNMEGLAVQVGGVDTLMYTQLPE